MADENRSRDVKLEVQGRKHVTILINISQNSIENDSASQ